MNDHHAAIAARWGALIRAKRSAAGLTQVALAELIDGDQPSVSNWERGEFVPSLESQTRLINALGITGSEIGAVYAPTEEAAAS
jgi:transcriptional regulator with XRE-family HTH domain